MQFTTPKRNVTLRIERVLSKPLVLLYRALKMNDYELSEKILAYFHFPEDWRLAVALWRKFATDRRNVTEAYVPDI